MQHSLFTNSSNYLNKLIQCHKEYNLFTHLKKFNKNVIDSIKDLYIGDDFENLFGPIDILKSEKLIEFAFLTNEIIVSSYNNVEIDRAKLAIVRTKKYQYSFIVGSITKEDNYALPIFKYKMSNENIVNTHDHELTELLLGQRKLIYIEDEECEEYPISDVFCVWKNDNFYYLVLENSYK